MKKIPQLLILLLLGSYAVTSNAQDAFLNLKSGKYTVEQNADRFVQDPQFQSTELLNGSYYRIITFEQSLKDEDRTTLASAGIQLLDYLPKRSYYASISVNADLNVLSTIEVVGVSEILPQYKLSKDLKNKEYGSWAISGDRITLKGVYHQGLELSDAVKTLEGLGARLEYSTEGNIVQFDVQMSQLDLLYEHPAFYYFEQKDAPEQKEGYTDVNNHRSNYINNPLGVGKEYDGTGVVVMMQDDGPIGPHIDYQGRTTTEAVFNNGDHGDHVAGIIMGAGNLDPDGVGNAPGAHLLVYASPNSMFNLVPNLVENEGLVITSKSYGDGQNAGYTSLARQLDIQCRDFTSLIHVFSAGNSGTSNFGYGAGAGWGNITGGHKQGKNVLAVGNLSATDALSSSSSRGPADDGRIKPDICAVGSSVNSTVDVNTYDIKSGTSMACPGVSGSLALLYEVYRDLHSGNDPDAALMNGAILNTADDLGNPGPDFKFGWGRINVRRAYELIESENYLTSEVSAGQTNSHTIEVPSGTKQLRVMVYWTDYQGTPSAQTALVNDINMSIADPSNTTYQPWVLDPTPNAGILDLDATPGIDDLNNVEQITIDDPAAGNYSLSIEGFDIPQGPQSYYVVYEFVEDEIVLTYPIGGESLVPGKQELVRWDTPGNTGTFKLEYSLDAGQNWTLISENVPGDWRSFPWLVPGSAVTGKALVRVSRDGKMDMSRAYVSVIDQAENLNIEWECPNSFNFSWDPVPGAVAYQVYLLGDKYMDSVGYVTETNATVYANSLQTQWVSVSAIGADGAFGKRAIAMEKPPGIGGCTLNDPFAIVSVICEETGPGSCIQFFDNSTEAGQGAAWEWSFPGGTPATSNQENPIICYDTEGTYDVELVVKNGVGEDTIFMSQWITIRKGEALPFEENFEAGVYPDWDYVNDGTQFGWGLDPTRSAYNYGDNCFMFNNFIEDSVGARSSFMTQQIDVSDPNALYELKFDVAYAPVQGASDSLFVYATNNCGTTKLLIYANGGDALATAGASTELFLPTGDQWRNEMADLGYLNGTTSIGFIFENYSAGGNAIYVDNINLRVSEDNFSPDLISTFPNPFTDELQIAGLVEGEETTMRITDANGKLIYENVFEAPGGTVTLNTSQFADGMYIIRITSASKTHKTKLIKGDG